MAKHEISNSDDVIDSRDVIARIEELEAKEVAITEAKQAVDAAYALFESDPERAGIIEDAEDTYDTAVSDFDEDEQEELKALKALRDEAEDYSEDWSDGSTLIRDSYFQDYAQEMVSDIGDMPREIPSYIVIDWEATANNIQVDYTEVDFDGVTYWIR